MAQPYRRKPKNQKQGQNTLWLIVGALFLVIVIMGAFIFYNRSAASSDLEAVSVDYPVGITEEGQPFKGGSDAQVVLTEFADFRCSHCNNFRIEIEKLEEEYLQSGEVKFVYINFPVLGQRSIDTAVAGECALEQGANYFWAYHDLMFEGQQRGDIFFTRENLERAAKEAGLNEEVFHQCLESDAPIQRLQADMEEGRARNVSGTPTLFLNGSRIEGTVDAARLESMFNEILN